MRLGLCRKAGHDTAVPARAHAHDTVDPGHDTAGPGCDTASWGLRHGQLGPATQPAGLATTLPVCAPGCACARLGAPVRAWVCSTALGWVFCAPDSVFLNQFDLVLFPSQFLDIVREPGS